MLRRILFALKFRFRARFIIRAKSRHEEPFATHMPILCALGSVLDVTRVLELGTGMFSTPLFLDRSVFPNVTRVVAVETDQAWAERVGATISDPRLELIVVASAGETVRGMTLDGFDLILVDDSSVEADRSATIRAVAAAAPSAVVVVHDVDVPAYRAASRAIAGRFIIRGFNPQTAVFRKEHPSAKTLRNIRRLVARNAALIKPTDTHAWCEVFPGTRVGISSARHDS